MTLPQFRSEAASALAVAARAEADGLDGVFVFDHLWPLGSPGRPALHGATLLAALAAVTGRVSVGSLVARVGVVDDDFLVQRIRTIQAVAGERLIAGLGTGDRANRAENEAYGVPYPPVAERLARMEACAAELRRAGIRTWIGGRSEAVRRAAGRAGGWNCWGTDVETFSREAAVVIESARSAGLAPPELTWGGQVLIGGDEREAARMLARHGGRPNLVHGTVADLRRHLLALEQAGASWAICAPLDFDEDSRVTQTLAMAAGSSLA